MNHLIGLIVPTLNADVGFEIWIESLKSQSLQPDRILVVDSSSDDETVSLARNAGFETLTISRSEFNHGGTRQRAVDFMSDMDILVFLTQDAVLASPSSLRTLTQCFDDELVGAAYGRQLPHVDAGLIAAHAREFNYGKITEKRSIADIPRLGIKTTFISNSFSAYRRSALMEAGGFPSKIIVSEDTCVAAKMLLSGLKVVYCAEATVHHSHDYSFIQEVARYFDIGVFHAREPWVRGIFGAIEGEGKRFVLSEIRYLARTAPWLIPSAVIRTVLKYTGFRLGLVEKKLPKALTRRISMQKAYWE